MIGYDKSRTWVTARASVDLTKVFYTLYQCVERDMNEWNSLYENEEFTPYIFVLGGSPEENEFQVISQRKPNAYGQNPRHVMFEQKENSIEVKTHKDGQPKVALEIALKWDSESSSWSLWSKGKQIDLNKISQLALENLFFPPKE